MFSLKTLSFAVLSLLQSGCSYVQLCPPSNWLHFCCFLLPSGRGERTQQVQKNISVADFFLPTFPDKQHKHTEIKAWWKGFARANTTTDVSVWMDFLWDRLCRPHSIRMCFLSPRQDTTVSSGLGLPQQHSVVLDTGEPT